MDKNEYAERRIRYYNENLIRMGNERIQQKRNKRFIDEIKAVAIFMSFVILGVTIMIIGMRSC